ncbi:hypothetical protein D3C80_1279930 [compost metagenome]
MRGYIGNAPRLADICFDQTTYPAPWLIFIARRKLYPVVSQPDQWLQKPLLLNQRRQIIPIVRFLDEVEDLEGVVRRPSQYLDARRGIARRMVSKHRIYQMTSEIDAIGPIAGIRHGTVLESDYRTWREDQ